MRCLLFLALWLCAILPLGAEPLKLVTWNLEWFPGGSPNPTPEQASAKMYQAQQAIRLLNPDILCLQEIRDWTAAAELVSTLPGYSVLVTSNFKGKQQQVIASRFPADSAWFAEWKSTSRLEVPRGYAFAAVRLPGNRILLVYSLHMKANSGGSDSSNIAKREEAAKQLAAHEKAMEAIYSRYASVAVVLAGDWNTTLDSDLRFRRETTIRSLLGVGFRSTWTGIPFEQRITHPGAGGYPPITFDHILTKNLGNVTATVVSKPGISDHNPVVLNILPDGGSLPITEPLPTPTPIPTPTPTPAPTTSDKEQGLGFKSFIPKMDDYSEIPGYKPKPSPTPTP